MLIHTPTDREKRMIFSFAWTGNELDPRIEAAEQRNSFLVSSWDFTEATLDRLGIRVEKSSQRERIRKAFDKANASIVNEFAEIKWRERRR